MHKASKQHLAQELLDVQRTLGWMDLVIGSIDDGVCVTDSQGKLIFANNYFAQLIGISRVFLLGQQMDTVIKLVKVDSPLPEYKDPHAKLLSETESDNGIYTWVDGHGTELKFRVSSRLLPNSDQRVFFIQNITREYELSTMKNNFVNLASHQLRTPMTAIMIYSNMLSSGFAGKLNEKQQAFADTVVHSSERMIHLVDELLKITRVQGEQQQYTAESIYIAEVFEKILAEIHPQISDKNLTYSIDIAPKTPVIRNDASVVHEILSNLLVNAVQYTRDGGKISVRIRHTPSNISMAITDTGIGIPPEHQPVLFNQFSRAENALSEYSDGTGLGLYLVKILLDKIGGSIRVKSTLHVGTTFTVKLPLRAAI